MTEIDTITDANGAPTGGQKAHHRATLLHYIEYIAYLAIRTIIRALPFNVASDLMAWFWRMIAPRIYRHERALKHLKRAYPELDDHAREAIAIRMWGHLGRTMAESFLIDRIAENTDLFEFDIPADVKELIDTRRPMILAALHLGNWELPAVAMRMMGVEIAGVYQRIANPLVDRAVRETRAPFYPLGILEKGQGAGKILMRLIRQGKSVGIVSDLRDSRGLGVEFFGQTAKSNSFPALLATIHSAPIVAIQCVRLKPDRFQIVMRTIRIGDFADRDDQVLKLTAALQAQFEAWIRSHPDQWMWAHRRWG